MYDKNLGVNFFRTWEFRGRFKRYPKTWSFEQLHDLYVRAKERADKRRKDFSDFIDKIIKEVEPIESGRSEKNYRVYFYLEDSRLEEKVPYMYSIRKDDYYGWTFSTERVTFSKDVVKGREDKINFLLSNNRQFELGEELRRLEKMKSNFDRHVFYIIEQAVNEKLCEKFKKVKNHLVPKVIKADLGGVVYYVALTKDSRSSGYDWKSFEILGPEHNDIIEL